MIDDRFPEDFDDEIGDVFGESVEEAEGGIIRGAYEVGSFFDGLGYVKVDGVMIPYKIRRLFYEYN